MTPRRRTRAYVIYIGTRMFLARGTDELDALHQIRTRHPNMAEYVSWHDHVKVREATPQDLELADWVDETTDRAKLDRWRATVKR